MADVHDKATRSKNMRAIATRDTAIEKRLAGLLSAQGIYVSYSGHDITGQAGLCGE